jgi:hypothetical protein
VPAGSGNNPLAPVVQERVGAPIGTLAARSAEPPWLHGLVLPVARLSA